MQLATLFKVTLLGLVLTAAGCSTTGGGSDAGAAGADVNGEGAYGAGDRAALSAEEQAAADAARAAAEAEQLLNITTFYFDFDQSTIKQEARVALEAHAAYLVQSGSNVVLEGHADERGTREYNLALGERRAQAIARYLTALGVSSQQIEAVSYGEERAASLGHDETSWSLNRRVDLRYGR